MKDTFGVMKILEEIIRIKLHSWEDIWAELEEYIEVECRDLV